MIRQPASCTIMTAVLLTGLAACGDREPDWAEMTEQHLQARDSANYFTINSVNQCAPDSEAPLLEEQVRVRCYLEAVMDADFSTVYSELGGTGESEAVEELVQYFGRGFRAGEEHTVSVTSTFRQQDGGWRIVD